LQRCTTSLVAFLVLAWPALAGQPSPPLAAGLHRPTAMAVGVDGKVYVCVLGETGKRAGAVLRIDDGKAVPFAAGLGEPRAMAAFGDALFVADRDRVWRIDRQGKAAVLTGPKSFPSPPHALGALDVDEEGKLYVADAGGSAGEGAAVYRVTPDGRVGRTVDLTTGSGPRRPGGLVMDGLSHVLLTDPDAGELWRIQLGTGARTRLASGLGRATALVWDQYGRLYVNDVRGGRVLVIPRPGEAAVQVADGFQDPAGLGLDPTGKFVIVADTRAGHVRAVSATVPDRKVDERPLPIRTEVAFPKLRWTGWQPESAQGLVVPLRPIVLTHAGDGTNRVFVATQHGVIHVYPNDQQAMRTRIFLDIQDRVSYDDNQNEEGFLGLAFHRNYKKTGEFFVFYTVKNPKLTNVLVRFRVRSDDPNRADPASGEELLRIQKPFWNHDGGTVCFGPDGYLYVAVGDGGAANDPYNHGQDLSKLFGKVLRLDVDHKDPGKNYAVPKDNPFVGRRGARPEIWAYGLRNVWRMAFDRKTGKLWASDVGQNLYEEIDLIDKGGNYGWNVREGLHPFGARGSGPRKDLIEPIWEYRHDVGKSLTGGLVYRGRRLPELDGWYLYADYVTAKVWALRYDEDRRRVVANWPIQGPNVPVLSFGEDEKGDAYFMTYTTSGQGIYRFVRAN
jgi:glucose/arabinose dehydrogenase